MDLVPIGVGQVKQALTHNYSSKTLPLLDDKRQAADLDITNTTTIVSPNSSQSCYVRSSSNLSPTVFPSDPSQPSLRSFTVVVAGLAAPAAATFLARDSIWFSVGRNGSRDMVPSPGVQPPTTRTSNEWAIHGMDRGQQRTNGWMDTRVGRTWRMWRFRFKCPRRWLDFKSPLNGQLARRAGWESRSLGGTGTATRARKTRPDHWIGSNKGWGRRPCERRKKEEPPTVILEK